VASLKGTEAATVIATKDGLLKRQAMPFTWDANDDSYIRTAVADRDINVQARMRRCLVTDVGAVSYLDADDSTKLAGDWVRLCETTELSTAYTGAHGAEVANNVLRSLAPAWAAGTFTKGAVVTNGGFVWECVAATTTAAPAAGTVAAKLDGTAGQVMVEVPLFSIRHAAPKVGGYRRHELSVALGVVQGGGYVVHPAFVKPDGSFRSSFYIGAYQGTGSNGNGSASGVNNAVSFTRAAARTAMAGRGAGWHQISYYQYSALVALLFSEYQDFESQRRLGNGAMTGGVYVVPTGLSNARGNRSANAHTPAGANSDYVSYRGVENIYGRAWQWVDGWNINERMCYLTGDPANFADNTAAKYQAVGMAPSGSGSFIRDIKEGSIFLADSVAGGSGATFTGDGLWTSSGWRVARVGAAANGGAPVGALCASLSDDSSGASTSLGGRISYAP
jgi:predicted regulator of Ras-like GTPase activity (Roadblock/LC7/MglB family)